MSEAITLIIVLTAILYLARLGQQKMRNIDNQACDGCPSKSSCLSGNCELPAYCHIEPPSKH